MLFRLPKTLPTFDQMLWDIGNPPNRQLAKALGIAERTVCRWKAKGDAPKPVMFALYWITQWGRSAVDAELYNSAEMYRGYVRAMEDEIKNLRAQLQQMGRIGDFGAVNDPAPDVVTTGKAAPAPELQREQVQPSCAVQHSGKPRSTARETVVSTGKIARRGGSQRKAA